MCTYEMDRKRRITLTARDVRESLLIKLKGHGYIPADKPALGKVMTIMVDSIVEGIMDELT